VIFRGITALQGQFARACDGAGYTIGVIAESTAYLALIGRRWREVVAQLFVASLGSLPLIVITALFTGMIIALQTGVELQRFGQESALGFVVPITICRGMGPVFTAIAVTGLIGSMMASELGTMKVSEEIDALEVMSIDPVYYLAMPRIFALALAVPLLTVYTDAIGTLGGAAVASAKFGVSTDLYFRNAWQILKLKDVFGGLLKAFIFGIVISGIACSQGMRATQGAVGVGRATLRTVVYSFVYILVFEYILTWAIYQ
jgi:phospholipid/cholesterol/gamma-HCH transport system permease protein